MANTLSVVDEGKTLYNYGLLTQLIFIDYVIKNRLSIDDRFIKKLIKNEQLLINAIEEGSIENIKQ